MNSTDVKDAEYEVVLRSRPGGPAILGVWGRPARPVPCPGWDERR